MLKEIAKKIGTSPETVSREIRNNKIIAMGYHPCEKDCIFAGGCKTHGLCKKEGCLKDVLLAVNLTVLNFAQDTTTAHVSSFPNHLIFVILAGRKENSRPIVHIT